MSGGRAELDPDEAYRRLRTEAVVVPVGRDVILVSGPDAASYLQGQVSQDVEHLEPGTTVWSLVLNPRGKLDALVRITRRDEDAFVLDTDAGYGPALGERLARFRLRVKVEIAGLDWQVVALRGPASEELSRSVTGALCAVPFDWGALTGTDCFGPRVTAGELRRAPIEAWEAVRVEAGVPVMGGELDERTIPAEAGLVASTVSFTKGCYTGQELVARLDARGSNVARRLRGVVVGDGAAGMPVEGGAQVPGGWVPAGLAPGGRAVALRPGAAVRVGDRVVGAVTSSAWSPTLQAAVGLAYVGRQVEPQAQVEVDASTGAGGERWVTAEVRELPLVG